MGKEFPVKSIRDLKFFLGVHVNKLLGRSLLLSQQQYLANMLHSANVGNLKPASTPMESKVNLHNDLPELDSWQGQRFVS